MLRAGRGLLGVAAFAIVVLGLAGRAEPVELGEGLVQIHGFGEMQVRAYSDSLRSDRWAFSQWANILNIESEFDLAPDGYGPFDLVQAFVRLEARYDCVFNRACGLGWSRPFKYFGKRSDSVPPNLADGRRSGLSGTLRFEPDSRIHRESELVSFLEVPPLDRIAAIATPASGEPPAGFSTTFAPVADALISVKHVKGSVTAEIFPIGPWHPNVRIHPNAALRSLDSPTIELPLRTAADTLYTPSEALLARINRFDSFDQNFSQREWQWNYGASQQQTRFLKEAYLDLELLDGRLFVRAGKQQIVWGKTELFRTTDQFNPQDIALSTLPSLEESRVALWSMRGIYSFYDVGPLEDVRFEAAANLDHFEPIDLGDCGEPYTLFLVCGKSFGLFTHGIIGLAVAGEERPPAPWNNARGLEFGARVEFRWDSFSFQISNFYGYSDTPYAFNFNEYERNVDPRTGRPRRANSRAGCDPDSLFDGDTSGCLLAGEAAGLNSGNRQFFDVFNRATLGLLGGENTPETLRELLGDKTLLDVFNLQATVPNPTGLGGDPTIAEAFSAALSGTRLGALTVGGILDPPPPPPPIILPTPVSGLARLNQDFRDGVNGNGTFRPHVGGVPGLVCSFLPAFTEGCLSDYLTPQQMALLGCGPFFGTDCDGRAAGAFPTAAGGMDLFNAEGSVLIQAFPQFEPGNVSPETTPECFVRSMATGEVFRLVPCLSGGAVATRFENGMLTTLPGARSIFDPLYDPSQDGCVGSSADLTDKLRLDTGQPLPDPGSDCDGTTLLGIDTQGDPILLGGLPLLFTNEMAAVSNNFLRLVATFDPAASDPAAACSIDDPFECTFVQAIFNLFGSRRPERRAGGNGRFGRRDFLWHGGSEIAVRYNKRNVLGLALDFAEDRSKTNWGMEFTWFENETYENTDTKSGFSRADTFNLTVSVDRPTFINFLNPNRTFLFNMQWFFRYIPHYRGGGRYTTDGPFSALGTFNIFTGYFQDRLIIFMTAVHDVGSSSGGGIGQVIYRFNERFSTSVGMAVFYGAPERQRVSLVEPALLNQGGSFMRRRAFNGLTAIAERDEFFVTLRYTF